MSFHILGLVDEAASWILRRVTATQSRYRRRGDCHRQPHRPMRRPVLDPSATRKRFDFSTVRVEATRSFVRLVFSAPGVKRSDLAVAVKDNAIVVSGHTVKGDQSFRIGRRVTPPHVADLDSAVATHAN